jgi:hypothetical protein
MACGGPSPSHPDHAAGKRGLQLRQSFQIQNDIQGGPHTTELHPDSAAGLLYVTDSFGGIIAYELATPGKIVFHTYDSVHAFMRCTTMAVHEPSHTLYCAAVDEPGIALLDSRSGAIRNLGQDGTKTEGIQNLLVVGDVLYAPDAIAGLFKYDIKADGTLGPPTKLLDLAIERMDFDGTSLWLGGRDIGLIELGLDGAMRKLADLTGPVIRLKVHDGRAAVAQGSQGALLLDTSTGKVLAQPRPQCVVSAVEFQGDVFAYGCYTGVFAYDLVRQRVFGWSHETRCAMDLLFLNGQLLSLDWEFLEFYDLHPARASFDVDYPPGYILPPGDGTQFLVRNPGDQTLHLHGKAIDPHGQLEVTVPASTKPLEQFDVSTDEGQQGVAVTILRQGAYPKIGQPFPLKGFENSYVYSSALTCALQFPALQDIDWLTQRHLFPHGLTPKILTAQNYRVMGDDNYMDRLATLYIPLVVYSLENYIPGSLGVDTYNTLLNTSEYIDGGDNDNEYAVDANGNVMGYERVYWGLFAPR